MTLLSKLAEMIDNSETQIAQEEEEVEADRLDSIEIEVEADRITLEDKAIPVSEAVEEAKIEVTLFRDVLHPPRKILSSSTTITTSNKLTNNSKKFYKSCKNPRLSTMTKEKTLKTKKARMWQIAAMRRTEKLRKNRTTSRKKRRTNRFMIKANPFLIPYPVKPLNVAKAVRIGERRRN
jgi:hypothetical protein